MKLRHISTALAALAVTATPVLAQSAVADLGRAIAPASSESAMEGDSTLLIILGIVAAGVAVAVLAGGDNGPDSP